jgi:hypothetical protein
MRIFGLALCFTIMGLIPQCIRQTEERIPDGVYQEPSKIEALRVTAKEIAFHINLPKGRQPGMVDRSYEYSLMSNREIHVFASSNDEVFVFGILAYKWIWDGTNIVRKARDKDEQVVFLRESTPSH